MAFRVDYLAKETGNNLVRNPTLTIATVMTVAISMTLFGSALLVRQGVEGFNSRFQDGVEFIVWMNAEATPENVETVRYFLESSQTIERVSYVNQEATFVEFQEYYADQPEVLDLVEPEQLPTSFRVVPKVTNLVSIKSLGDEIVTLAGVSGVDYAEEYIKQLNELTSGFSTVMIVAALFAALVSAMLMYNTIRTGMFARRREIEVMRLVGATKSFIRIPFMMEGLLQGVIGALFASVIVFGLNKIISRSIEGKSDLAILESFALGTDEVAFVAIVLIGAGAALGAFGAGIAVTRYLDA
jgi:cell division transport system permease protein